MYLIELGRNTDLSKLEFCVLANKQLSDYKTKEDLGKYLLIDSTDVNFSSLIKRLAGNTRIISLLNITPDPSLDWLSKLPLDNFYEEFSLAICSVNIDQNYLEKVVREVKLIAKKKHLEVKYRSINNPDWIEPKNFFSWGLDSGMEIFMLKHKDTYYLGYTSGCKDPAEIVFKDNKRPSRFFSHGSSFRTAQIMINLLAQDKGKVIVDPFCGTGTFLIEALISGCNAIGIDNDPKLVNSARQNVNWARNQFKLQNTCKIIEGDSQLAEFNADAAVFEPYMGPFLERLPTDQEAYRTANELSILYRNVFKNLADSLNAKARIACILPEFLTTNNNLVELEHDIFTSSGFKIIDVSEINTDISLHNPVAYSAADGSNIQRKVFLLQKI